MKTTVLALTLLLFSGCGYDGYMVAADNGCWDYVSSPEWHGMEITFHVHGVDITVPEDQHPVLLVGTCDEL